MKRFILYILSFLLPVAVILTVMECTLRSIPNTYRYKDQIFPAQYASSVKIMSLGSSHGYFGICPSYFSQPAYNMGFPTQSLKYDNYLLHRYIHLCDSLQCVIIPVSYNSFRDDLESGPEWIRTKGYCMYMGCNYHKGEPRFNYELFGNFNANVLSTVFRAWRGEENHISCDSLGWGKGYLFCNRASDWEHQGNRASGHTILHQKYVNDNIQYLESMLEICQAKGINVILLTTPTYKSYYNNLNSEQWVEMQQICNDLVLKYANSRYYNWLSDDRFNESDFFDGDHLNEFGSEKMSRMLDEIIKNW